MSRLMSIANFSIVETYWWHWKWFCFCRCDLTLLCTYVIGLFLDRVVLSEFLDERSRCCTAFGQVLFLSMPVTWAGRCIPASQTCVCRGRTGYSYSPSLTNSKNILFMMRIWNQSMLQLTQVCGGDGTSIYQDAWRCVGICPGNKIVGSDCSTHIWLD